MKNGIAKYASTTSVLVPKHDGVWEPVWKKEIPVSS